MIVMAMRSSTTARVSRNERSALGRCVPMTASTASANAMSVAVGIAQPRSMPPSSLALSPWLISAAVTTNRIAGSATPHTAAAIGQRGLAPVGQVARDELALELDAGDEEEDGEQAVGRPGAEATGRGAGRAGR